MSRRKIYKLMPQKSSIGFERWCAIKHRVWIRIDIPFSDNNSNPADRNTYKTRWWRLKMTTCNQDFIGKYMQKNGFCVPSCVWGHWPLWAGCGDSRSSKKGRNGLTSTKKKKKIDTSKTLDRQYLWYVKKCKKEDLEFSQPITV